MKPINHKHLARYINRLRQIVSDHIEAMNDPHSERPRDHQEQVEQVVKGMGEVIASDPALSGDLMISTLPNSYKDSFYTNSSSQNNLEQLLESWSEDEKVFSEDRASARDYSRILEQLVEGNSV